MKITKIITIRNVGIIALLALTCGFNAAIAKQPNILFIFADDQAPNTVGAYGAELVKTPNLDRLAERGVLFNRAYNSGSFSSGVCVASRAMLNTGAFVWNAAAFYGAGTFTPGGKYEPRVGESYTIEKRIPEAYWAQYMSQAGYETYFTGKWHVKANAAEVFDHAVHVRKGMPAQSKKRYSRKFIEGQPDTWSPYNKKMGGFWKGGKHWSEVLADDSLAFIEQAKQSDKPFFMYLAFNAPHDPRQAPKEYVEMYPLDDIKVPENFLPEYPYNEYAGAGRTLRDETLAPFPRTEYSVKKNLQEYYAIVSHMDAQIGRILDALEASGMAEETYIFYSADHGLAIGDHGFIGKQNMYDHSMRVPLMMVGPGLEAGKQVDAPVYLQDIMATSIELSGLDKPAQVEFSSLLPLATGKTKQSVYDAIYGCYYSNQRMVLTDKYKMIIYPAANMVRLYDVRVDPLEINDLAVNKEQNVELLNTLLGQLQKLQREMNDPIEVTEAFNNFMNDVQPPPLPR